MTRRTDERSALRPLLADLARQIAASHGEWAARIDPRVLRRFSRQVHDAELLLSDSSASAAGVDKARSIAAEVLVCARLLDAGCEVEHEVETPNGRHVDFRARRDGAVLCVHVKRAPQPTLRDAQVSVPAAWRTLESVDRGLVVALALTRNLRGMQLQSALADAMTFVEQASVGEECSFRGADGRVAARLRVIAPSTQRRLELVADLSASFDDHVPRFQATLRKAFAQFMPRSENLIVVAGSSGGIDAFATALLGSHIERWDKRPRAGELVAYGRGGDGFWAGSLRNQSRLAAYWTLARGNGPLLFLREPGARAGAATTPASSTSAGAIRLARSVFA
jgi:hypothetical protein